GGTEGTGQANGLIRADEGGDWLDEGLGRRVRLGRRLLTALADVLAVVAGEAEDLGRVGDGRAQAHRRSGEPPARLGALSGEGLQSGHEVERSRAGGEHGGHLAEGAGVVARG